MHELARASVADRPPRLRPITSIARPARRRYGRDPRRRRAVAGSGGHGPSRRPTRPTLCARTTKTRSRSTNRARQLFPTSAVSRSFDQRWRPHRARVSRFAAVLDHTATLCLPAYCGDVFVVMRDTETAAACALDLQDAMTRCPEEAHGFAELALRPDHTCPVCHSGPYPRIDVYVDLM